MRLTKTKEWKNLEEVAKKLKKENVQIKDLMKEKDRIKATSYCLEDLYIDLSKNLISSDIRKDLNNLAKAMKVEEAAKKMFSGEKINLTEKRAVLHTALRNVKHTKKSGFKAISSVMFEGVDIMNDIVETLNRMALFTEKVRSGKWKGANGNKINTIVNIGIGGSDLGVKMITRALNPYKTEKLEFRFVSNVDGTDIVENLRGLDPAKTMFIIASKTFTTQETMTNAETAKRWFLKKMKEKDVAKHFVAASTAEKLVKEFGIDTDNMFPFWDWVGGRYSSPSAIGLPVMLAVGADNFGKLLTGYNLMDRHFLETPIENNIPIQLALTGIWYNNFLGAETTAILAYDQSMEFFAQYFQQADMESNGKSVNIFGEAINYQTGPIVWGEPGTNGQHAFYQLIHQGTKLIPADFIAFAESHNKISDHHEKLMSNFFAQTKALMLGLSAEELEKQNCPKELIPFRTFTGNKPTNSILIKKLTPKTLGMLIAMYEHKIFTQGVIWQVNSFDQYGVELGKILAKDILKNIIEEKTDTKNNDASTVSLLGEFFKMR